MDISGLQQFGEYAVLALIAAFFGYFIGEGIGGADWPEWPKTTLTVLFMLIGSAADLFFVSLFFHLSSDTSLQVSPDALGWLAVFGAFFTALCAGTGLATDAYSPPAKPTPAQEILNHTATTASEIDRNADDYQRGLAAIVERRKR